MMCGRDPDYAKRDLFEHISKGGDARWTMFIQVMKPEEAASVRLSCLRWHFWWWLNLMAGYLRPLRRHEGLAPRTVPHARGRRAHLEPQSGGFNPSPSVSIVTDWAGPWQDYHRDVEQAAFSPGSLVPGIELSPDSLLQWRAFFYRDAQYHRLGSANIHQIPVNCPFMANFHR
jgi:catalase